MIDKEKILESRKIVDAYRIAHAQLGSGGYHKDFSENHANLSRKLIKDINNLGFTSIQEFFDDNDLLNLNESGILDNKIWINRYDLALIGNPQEWDGVATKIIESKYGDTIQLVLDGNSIMSTSIDEHLSMRDAVSKCPQNARCFVAGLGLGLILLYLAESNKTTEVIVCEVDARIIQLLGEQIKQWMINNYPNFNLHIIHGDAFSEITKWGNFDWIFFDTNWEQLEENSKAIISSSLSDNGVYTSWQSYGVQEWH